MGTQFKSYFSARWEKYFASAELPIVYFYTDQPDEGDLQESTRQGRCLICNLNPVREGKAFVYSADTPGCTGGKRYTGFSQKLRPNFEYFLSCGIPGKLEGERYKRTPQLVQKHLERNPPFQAPAKYLVFKRWDRLAADEEPLAVIFFATADVLSGLFTLANYDYAGSDGVIAPMGSGCASIINYPYLEAASDAPRCVLGMFDVSARPCVPEATLTFTVPMRRFEQMVANMDESFLITKSWNEVCQRL
jgi:uncharacterized protein (DUF169 family)